MKPRWLFLIPCQTPKSFLALHRCDVRCLRPREEGVYFTGARVALDVVAPLVTPLRIAIAPGVSVGKWTTRWQERRPDVPVEVLPTADPDGVAVLRSGEATVSFLRLPIEREGLSVIRLYSEVPVLVVSRDSPLAERESVSLTEVRGLPGLVDYPPTGTVKDAVALVAAGVGALRLPFSVTRFAARKDVVAVPVSDAEPTEIAVCWLTDDTTEIIEQFIGVVRGRTANSSR